MWRRGSGWKLISAVTLPLLLTGCGTNGTVTGDCAWAEPIYIGDADDLTDETARQILAHNQTGAEICGWSPST